MGSIPADVVIEKASIQLEDRGFANWLKPDLLSYLNDGQIAIVGLRPDAKTHVDTVQLAAGTRQTIAHPDLRVLDVARNMGTNGTTPGRAIRFIENRAELDLEVPNWHAAPPNATVRQWMYDQRIPSTWWVYPPQPASGQGHVDLVTSRLPTSCTIANVNGGPTTTSIDIDDIYVNPLVEFIVWKAFARDAEYTKAGGKGQLAQSSFFAFFGIKTEADRRFRPEKSNPPLYSPPPKGNDGALGER